MGTSSADFLGRGLRRWLGAAGVLSGLAILSAPAEQAPALVISPDGQQIVLHWVAIPPPLCQPRAMLGETQNPFFLTRAAASTCGREKDNSLSGAMLLVLLLG